VEEAPSPDQPDTMIRIILKGDVNEDCNVSILDLIRVGSDLGQSSGSGDNWKADLNKDGKIHVLDLILTRNAMGTRCP